MGRPLSKKYFGNRNTGSASTTTDDGIGGKGVASAAINNAGSFTTMPSALTFTAPQLPGGVTAVGTVVAEALSAAVSGTQTKAYQVGQTLTVTTANGTSTYTVASLAAPAAALANVATTSVTGDISFDSTDVMIPGTSVKVTGTDTDGTLIVAGTYYVKTATATTATLVSTYSAAISGTGGAITTAVKGTSTGLTFTPGDGTGSGAAAAAGQVATVTPNSRGSYTTLDSGAKNTTTVDGGVGAKLTITYRAKSVTITEQGSGYTSAPTATTDQGVTINNIVLVTNSGNVGSSTYSEPAITITAYLPGGSAKTADIIKQVSTNRYKVKNADGTGIVKLKSSAVSAAGEASIVATDSDSGTYYVTKLTAKKATITRGTGTQFATGESVPWTLGTATSGYSVKIPNA